MGGFNETKVGLAIDSIARFSKNMISTLIDNFIYKFEGARARLAIDSIARSLWNIMSKFFNGLLDFLSRLRAAAIRIKGDVIIMSVGRRNGASDESDDYWKWTMQGLLLIGLVGAIFLLLYCLYGATHLKAVDSWWGLRLSGLYGGLALLGFASFSLGAVLGFLFGIPKSVVEENRPTPNPATPQAVTDRKRFRSNTNLEEMSDWLTKVIVGAGLVGLKDFLHYFGQLVTHMAAGFVNMPFATMVVGADMISFAVLGFFSVYLVTRLYLANAFSKVEDQMFIAIARTQSTAELNLGVMSDKEKVWLKRTLNAYMNNAPYTLAKGFRRASDDHMALRSLEDRLLVRPTVGSEWRTGTTLELTPLAKELISKLQTLTANVQP